MRLRFCHRLIVEDRKSDEHGDYPLVAGRESAHDEGGRFAYADS
jgi:hypothetical protein